MPRARQLTQQLVDLTVLALLSETPRHPYDMHRQIRLRNKTFLMGLPRSLYHAVDRLDREGLVEPMETQRDGNRPERTVYRLTEDGSAQFHLRLSELLTNPSADYPAFTAAVSFLTRLEPGTAREVLELRATMLEGQIAELDARIRPAGPRPAMLETEHLRAIRAAELEWVRSIAADIATGRLTWNSADATAHA
jgi:DNA-binding PadR family transcriptional regulator